MGQQKAQAGKKRATGGNRPKSPLPDRNQIRHAPGEWEAWTEHALSLGFGSAGAWIRKLANDAVAAASKNGTHP